MLKTSRDTIDRLISEKDFLSTVIEFAQAHGWKVAHFRPAMTGRLRRDGKPVWVTPVQGDGKGFPDLVLVRTDRLIFAEVKAEKGRIVPNQERWLGALLTSGQQVYVWRPSNWEEIEGILE